MSENTVKARLRHAVKPEATWTSDNPVLKEGEVGYVKETGRYKVGDGKTAWNSLAWAQPSSHTHDDRYYTETEIDTKLKTKSDTGHTHNYAGASIPGGAANSAVKLATPKMINGTSFDGTGNITTANWGTSRNITIGNTKKAVNGGGDISWSLAEIGCPTSKTISDYVASRGENLVTNGTCLLGNNTNFSSFTYDGSETYYAGGSFKTSTLNGVFTNDEYIPVDVNQTYKFSYYIKSSNDSARYFDYVSMYDIDKNNIQASNVMWIEGSTTTLAKELKKGDTKVYLTSVAGFNTSTTYNYQRGLTFWNYQNSKGYSYGKETYSRNTWSDLWTDGASIDKTNNTITLKTAWTHGTFPAGTFVSQRSDGGSYTYLNQNFLLSPANTWIYKTEVLNGTGKNNALRKFREGTAFVKVGWLVNRNVSAPTTCWISTVSFTQNSNIITSAGSVTQPVYFSNGKPVACTYTIAKSVPSDAKFTDTTYTAGRGITLSGTQFKLNDNCSSATDWDTVTTTGWYMASDAANAPATGWLYGEVIAHNPKYTRQILYRFATNSDITSNRCDRYERVQHNGTWGDWVNTSVRTEVPAGAKFTDTWRGIQNNLTSDSASDSLAAAQGKALKALIDGKAPSTHTHTKSQITDFPTSLKNPTNLILRLNGGTTEGTNQFTYDGSTAKTISITPAGIGAATSGHNHDSAYLGKTATAAAATKATQDSAGQQINTTYIKGLSVSGKTITYTRGDNTTGTITTQDNDTHYTTGLKVCASATGTANAAATNGNVRINVLDNTTVRDSHIIKGTGATTVTSDASGVITINSASYSTGTASTVGLTKLYTSTGTSTDGTMTRKAITDALSGKAASNHNHDGDYVPLENGTVTVSSDMGAYIDLQDTNGGLGTHLQMSVKGASKWDLAANSNGELSLTYITSAGSNWLYAMNASGINMYQSVTVRPSPLATTANSMMVKVTTAGLQNFTGRTISLYASGSDNNYAGIYDHDNGWILYCDTDKVVHIPKALSTTSVTVSGNLQWRNSSGTAYVIAGTLSNDSYKNMTRIGNLTYETGIYTKTNVWKNGSTTTHFATTTTTSDQRLKEKISDMSVYEDFFCKLKPFAFKYHEGLYNANGTKPMIQWGYGAQDTVKAFKESGLDWQQEELVVIEDGELTEEEKKYTTDGKMFKMNYQNMSALNTHMIQKCLEEIAELKRQLVELKEG